MSQNTDNTAQHTPRNYLSNSLVFKLYGYLQSIAAGNGFSASDTYQSIATAAEKELGFPLTKGNISGAFADLGLKLPAAKPPKEEALRTTIAALTARIAHLEETRNALLYASGLPLQKLPRQ